MIQPDYKGLCYSNIVGTIESLLTGGTDNRKLPEDAVNSLPPKVEKVIFMYVDALGYDTFEKYKDKSIFLKEILKRGNVKRITSQFPSSTTAHVTTLMLGEDVSKHGYIDWYTYEPEIDDIIVPFLFSRSSNEEKDSLLKEGINPSFYMRNDNFISRLKEKGVKSYIFQQDFINNSVYTKTLCKDGEIINFSNYSDLYNKLIEALKDNGSNFYYVYIPQIDSVCHKFGKSSKEFEEEVLLFINKLDELFFKEGNDKIKDTAFLLSTDHGQTTIEKYYVLNEIVPEIEKYFKLKNDGNIIPPTGYSRDMFLHLKEEMKGEGISLLKEKLKSIADVYSIDEMINFGMFYEVSEKFKERVGNTIILPKRGIGIWWEDGRNNNPFIGSHGGATQEEMYIPFLAYYFDKE